MQVVERFGEPGGARTRYTRLESVTCGKHEATEPIKPIIHAKAATWARHCRSTYRELTNCRTSTPPTLQTFGMRRRSLDGQQRRVSLFAHLEGPGRETCQRALVLTHLSHLFRGASQPPDLNEGRSGLTPGPQKCGSMEGQLDAVSLIECTPQSNRNKTTQPRRSGLSLRKAAAVRGLVAEKKIDCE
jgi:hypothetical protein